jgi:hypothetical protein
MVVTLSVITVGDRTFETSEVNALLQTLTASPKSTWLSSGTIRAQYLEFRVGEETAYESEELFRFDGQRFYWEILLMDPPAESAAPAVERPDHQTNKHRIFTYDGNAYTRYYKSADYAVVVMNQQEVPVNLFGPFSAGVIPWGFGSFTYSNLLARNPRVAEYQENGHSRVRLTLTDTTLDAPFVTIIELDPAKQYAPCSYKLQSPASSIQHCYRDIRQVGQSWVPFIITVERFDLRGASPSLVSYEDWRFLSVDGQMPTGGYSTPFANGTVVELQPYGQMKSYMYHAAEGVDIARLLEEKVTTLSAQNNPKANCAMLSAGHVARRFSKQVSQPQAAASDTGGTSMTSLYAMRQSLEGAGLYCAAVKTDTESLAGFSKYGVILHFPGVKHYVALDRIENGSVWTVDLTSRKFYWKRSFRELQTDWTDGIALLVSDSPILLTGQVQFLDTVEQEAILGGSTVGYSCTDLIQTYEHILCSQPVGGLCGGGYYKIWERYGCREDEPGMTCVGQKMVGYDYSHCINHPYQPGWCEITGRWYSRYIRACQ